MKESINNYKQDKIVKISSFTSLFFVLITLGSMFLIRSSLPPYVPFLNSMPWGDGRLIEVRYVFVLPVSFFVFFLLNSFLSAIIYSKYLLVSRILTVNNLLIVLLGFLAYLQMIFLVF